MENLSVTRRDVLRLSGLVAGAGLIAACSPTTVEVIKTLEEIKTVEVPGECEPQAEKIKTYPAAPLLKAESFELESSTNGRTYDIFVSFPLGYPGDGIKYHALYVTDADLTLGIPSSLSGILGSAGKIPQMVVVGIGYHIQSIEDFNPSRERDMIPVLDNGGSQQFLDFIEKDLIPIMENLFPVDKDRVLWGHSLGGNFALYAMFKKPTLFKYIHASSPTPNSDEVLYTLEAEAAARKLSIPAACLITIGSLEQPESIASCREFTEKLKTNGYSDLHVQLMELENENHVTASVAGFFYGFPNLIPLQPG